MADLRLDIRFPDNPKTKKLVRELGDSGLAAIVRLWCYVAQHFPKGVISGTLDDIEEFAGWRGIRGVFVSYTERMRWIEKTDEGNYQIHDWKEHQPWVFHSDTRSAIAKRAIAVRWERKGKQGVNTQRIRNVIRNDEMRNTPSPSPSPSPTSQNHIPYDRIVDFLNRETGARFRAVGGKTRRLIHARWQEGFRTEDFAKVIRAKVEHWKDDEKMSRFLRPETLFGTKFESYLQEYREEEPAT